MTYCQLLGELLVVTYDLHTESLALGRKKAEELYICDNFKIIHFYELYIVKAHNDRRGLYMSGNVDWEHTRMRGRPVHTNHRMMPQKALGRLQWPIRTALQGEMGG